MLKVLKAAIEGDLTDRVIGRIRKSVLTKPGIEYYTWRYVANARPTMLALFHRSTQPGIKEPISTLRRDGIVVGPSSELLGTLGSGALPEIRAEVFRLNDGLEDTKSTAKKDYIARVIRENQPIDANHPLARLALDQKLLEIVSGYLGFWPRLHSTAAWVTFPMITAPRQAQLWHRDPEDVRTAKMFIYLTDVDDESGPFTYVPGTQALGRNAEAAARFRSKSRTSDEQFSEVFPSDTWIKCTGAAGTMFVADTRGYHQGGRVERGRRLLVCATYVSSHSFGKPMHQISGDPTWSPTSLQKFALTGVG